MTTCTTRALSLGYPKTVQELGISVLGSSYPDRCLIRCANVCFAGSKDLYLDIGETQTVTCDDHLDYYWEVSYIEYFSEYSVRVKVCKITTEEPPEPSPPPEVGEVDYERIERKTAAIVNASETTITDDISEVAGGVSGVHAALNSMNAGLTSQVTDQTTTLTGLIGDTKQGLVDQITGLSTSLTGSIQAISDKIDGLTFPTLDSIKGAFLDVCSDLAIALWDAILDKIEERYPKDEEETK